MTIAADSRYAFGDYVSLLVEENVYNIAVFAKPVEIDNVSISYYISTVGDRFDTLAQRFFGDPTKWWVIADLNPEVTWPGIIPGASMLRIPVVSDSLDLGISSTINDFILNGGVSGA